jgi:hypothetical protein
LPFGDGIAASENQTRRSLHERLPFTHVAYPKVIKKTFYCTLRLVPLFKIPDGGCLIAKPTNWTPLYTRSTRHSKGSGKHNDPLPKFLISWVTCKSCPISPIIRKISCFEIILYLGLLNVYTSIKLGEHHGSENQILHFFRKRSALCCGSGLPVLRGRDLGIHVMLSQALISLLLMAGILAVFTLAIRYHW